MQAQFNNVQKALKDRTDELAKDKSAASQTLAQEHQKLLDSQTASVKQLASLQSQLSSIQAQAESEQKTLKAKL